jgi:hypothetical protein
MQQGELRFFRIFTLVGLCLCQSFSVFPELAGKTERFFLLPKTQKKQFSWFPPQPYINIRRGLGWEQLTDFGLRYKVFPVSLPRGWFSRRERLK